MTPCAKDTERCEFWTWGNDYLRPDCCTDHLKELLFFTESLFTSYGITHWLDYGTLLGAVRHQAFIPWDSDVDLGVFRADLARIRALEPHIARAGYQLDTRNPNVWRINYSARNTQHVDLYPWREDGDVLTMRWPGEPAERWAFPARFLARPERVTVYGRELPAPSPVHEFLARHRYGAAYQTPRRPEALEEDRRIEQAVRAFLAKRHQVHLFEKNLVLLNDVLGATPFASRYWVIGGLLLGWARDGCILAHDARDADFGFLREDREAWLAAVPDLVRAGFRPFRRWVSNDGTPVEYSLSKDGAQFEFFEHERFERKIRCTFFGGMPVGGMRTVLEMVSEVRAFDTAPMNFLGRRWHVPTPHEAYLAAVYGDWQVPNPDHDYKTDDRSIVDRYPWTGSYDWDVEDGTGAS